MTGYHSLLHFMRCLLVLHDFPDCDAVYYSDSGYVTSPNYPNNYPNNADCKIRISPISLGGERRFGYIQLTFLDFDLEYGGFHCPWDALEVIIFLR